MSVVGHVVGDEKYERVIWNVCMRFSRMVCVLRKFEGIVFGSLVFISLV